MFLHSSVNKTFYVRQDSRELIVGIDSFGILKKEESSVKISTWLNFPNVPNEIMFIDHCLVSRSQR